MWAPVEGRYGRTRDGRKVGPIVPSGRGDRWPWDACGTSEAPGTLWTATGRYSLNGSDHPLDLVAEWVDDGPVRTVTRQVTGEEVDRYAIRAGEMSEGGQYRWWTRLAEILSDYQALKAEHDALARKFEAADTCGLCGWKDRAEAAEQQVRDMRGQVEQAFRDGLAYGSNVEGADPDIEWQHSRARLLLKEGGE